MSFWALIARAPSIVVDMPKPPIASDNAESTTRIIFSLVNASPVCSPSLRSALIITISWSPPVKPSLYPLVAATFGIAVNISLRVCLRNSPDNNRLAISASGPRTASNSPLTVAAIKVTSAESLTYLATSAERFSGLGSFLIFSVMKSTRSCVAGPSSMPILVPITPGLLNNKPEAITGANCGIASPSLLATYVPASPIPPTSVKSLSREA